MWCHLHCDALNHFNIVYTGHLYGFYGRNLFLLSYITTMPCALSLYLSVNGTLWFGSHFHMILLKRLEMVVSSGKSGTGHPWWKHLENSCLLCTSSYRFWNVPWPRPVTETSHRWASSRARFRALGTIVPELFSKPQCHDDLMYTEFKKHIPS